MTLTRRDFIKGAGASMALVVAGPLVVTPRASPLGAEAQPLAFMGLPTSLYPACRFTFEDIRRIALAVPRVRNVRITEGAAFTGEVLVEVDRNPRAVVQALEYHRPACVSVVVQRMAFRDWAKLPGRLGWMRSPV